MKPMNLPTRLEISRSRAMQHRNFFEKYIKLLDALLATPEHEGNVEYIERALDLMTLPRTAHGNDFKGIAKHLLQQLTTGGTIDDTTRNILENYEELPSEEWVEMIAANEHEVAAGKYDKYLKPDAKPKFDAKQKELDEDAQLKTKIADLFRRHPKFAGKRQTIWRSLWLERGYAPVDLPFDPADPKSVAQTEFNSLCERYHLLGVERTPDGFKPLLQKLSVNFTPHGVMIFIPSYWSLDAARDIDWKQICILLKAWGSKRSGAKWAEAREANRKQCKAVAKAWAEATKDGRTGEERYERVKEKAGLHPDTDPGLIHRMVKRGGG